MQGWIANWSANLYPLGLIPGCQPMTHQHNLLFLDQRTAHQGGSSRGGDVCAAWEKIAVRSG